MKKKKIKPAVPFSRIRRKLIRLGWTIETEAKVVETIPVEVDVKFTHPDLGEVKTISEACGLQKEHKRNLRDTNKVADYLISNNWTLTDRGQWYRPNWNLAFNEKQQEEFNQKKYSIEPGCYATLIRAQKIQRKLDSFKELETETKNVSQDTAV